MMSVLKRFHCNCLGNKKIDSNNKTMMIPLRVQPNHQYNHADNWELNQPTKLSKEYKVYFLDFLFFFSFLTRMRILYDNIVDKRFSKIPL